MPTPSEHWRTAPLTDADAPDMRGLFAESFGTAMSEPLWHWKYGDGHGLAMGVWNAQGGLTAHYGGMPRALLDAGQPCMGVQIGDVMVRQRDRASLSRKGPFFLAASHFLDAHVGDGKPYRYGFGFPNKRAMDVADRLGLYGAVGQLCELRWDIEGEAALPWWMGIAPVTSTQGLETTIDRLWRRMADSLPQAILGVRDHARMQYRYLDHPERLHTLWLIRHRLTRRPIGLIVLRHHAGHSEWTDLVAPVANWDACALAARHLARRHGGQALTMWLADSYAAYFHDQPTRTALDVIVPCNLWTPGPDIESQRGRWLLMAGDTDFL